ncbi:MAG: amidohydrolase [Saprospiraceae bacterium]
MEKSLRITTVQSTLHWENAAENLSMFSKKLEGLAGKTDLVVLPEMFNTGFSMNAAAIAETMQGRTLDWLGKKAAELNAVVTGSLVIEDNGKFYNRLVWMQPDYCYELYDKRHLFTLAGEHEHYTAGKRKLIVAWKGWKICPLICYDLRFPVWSRNTENYDLLLYMANWPEKRGHHWRQLLMARAIENQSYVVGVNRVGEDANGFKYQGDTSVIDYAGNLLYRTAQVEDIFTITLHLDNMEAYRNNLQFLPDQDRYKILD